jgi:hypothetical protein
MPCVQQAQRILVATAIGSPDTAKRLDAIVHLATIGSRVECPGGLDQILAVMLTAAAARETRRALVRGTVDPVAARARLDPLYRTRWIDRMAPLISGTRAGVIQMYRTVLDGTFPREELLKAAETMKSVTSTPLFGDLPKPGAAARIVSDCEGLTRALAVPVSSYSEYRAAVAKAMTPPGEQPSAEAVSMSRRISAHCRTDAAQRLARIALAAAEHRATRGDFPASLDDLAWAFPDGIPLDPFNEMPFVFEDTATGVRIASVGWTAGQTPPDAAELRERCLVWELRR